MKTHMRQRTREHTGTDTGWPQLGTYVNGPEASAVAGSHVLVESLNGVGSGRLSVLLVHVVGAGAGVVADPDTEVLDLQGLLLMDLIDRERKGQK